MESSTVEVLEILFILSRIPFIDFEHFVQKPNIVVVRIIYRPGNGTEKLKTEEP